MASLAFVGDVMLFAPVALASPPPGRLVVNLETPIVPDGVPPRPHKVVLRADRDHLAATFGDALAAVNLANNHAVDFGAAGLATTVAAVEARGVPVFGAGTLAEGGRNPAWLTVDGVRVALLGYACRTTHAVPATEREPGVVPLEPARVAADVAAARGAGADRVVVNVHWGMEHVGLPRPEDVALARGFVDAGADLVVGHHAHVAQPWEVYRGCTIAYGLGSFVMPDLDLPTEYDETGVPRGRLTKRSRRRHRRSLMASWDPRTNAVVWSAWELAGDRVRCIAAAAAPPPLDHDPDSYPRRFRRAVLRDVWLDRIGNYLARPVLPRPRHLRSVLRITAGALRAGSRP